MSDVFSEIDLNDHPTSDRGTESPSVLRAHRKKFSMSHRYISTSPSPTNQITAASHLHSSFHEISSPPLSLLDSSNSLSSNYSTPSNASRFQPISISPPLPSSSSSSDPASVSPKSFLRSTGPLDLARRSFHFPLSRQDSLIDTLLSAIYEREGSTYGLSSSQDSDTVTTEELTDSNPRRFSDDSILNSENTNFSKSNLSNKNLQDLRYLCTQLQQQISQENAVLVKNLRHRDKNLSKLQRNCDVITAVLQAASLKRREDTTMRFSLTPGPGEKGFQQWKDAISVATRMPGGLPPSIRQKLWLSLAANYIREIHLDWEKTCRFAFNNCSNPDDDQLGIQIVKDLHRTGCSWSSNEHDRATLKRVLLAFARYNKSIGYCQGLNILTAVILDVVHMNEEFALMILIYLIDSILPNFFANNLRALAIDMTVFREWLRLYNNRLHIHLQSLQLTSSDSSGTIYEPPLLNVFTIQWFLTLFATCLPRSATLRVWDALMIEGSEVLFRTGLVLWTKLAVPILKVTTADQFYSTMAQLSVQLLDEKIIDTDTLIKEIYNIGPFPTPVLSELRQKFAFNITPFQQISSAGTNPSENDNGKRPATRTGSDETKSKESKRTKVKSNAIDEETGATAAEEEMASVMSCFAILSTPSRNTRVEHHANESAANNNPAALSRLTPGAYSNLPTTHKTNSIEDSLSLDISQLRQQYRKLKERNKQVQVMIQTATNEQKHRSRAPSIHPSTSSAAEEFRRPTVPSLEFSSSKLPFSVCSITGGPLVNHLLIKPVDIKRNQLRKTFSMKTSTSTPPTPTVPGHDRPTKVVRAPITEASPMEKPKRTKEQEAEEAAELQQEIDQLLTSLNLEKPIVQATKTEQIAPTEQSNQLGDVARTFYEYGQTEVTTTTPDEKKEPSHILDRILTSRSVQVPKYSSFNPFPSRSFNENVAMNGYKLGLYAPDPTPR